MKTTVNDLEKIKYIDSKLSTEIVSYFEDQLNVEIINKLKEIGLKFVGESKSVSDKFKDKTFVIKGTLQELRNYYKDLIEAKGGISILSWTKVLEYVFV